MAEFEMISSQKVEFNNGGEFIELSINVVKDGAKETPYLRLARGFYSSEGEPRYKKGGTTLPMNREVLAQIGEALKTWDIAEGEKRQQKAAAAKAPAAKKGAAAESED